MPMCEPSSGGGKECCRQSEQIMQSGSVTVPAESGSHLIHCLTVIGQIEGHYTLSAQNKTTKYEHVIPQLVAIEESPQIKGLLIILNTVGGDVEAGLAIAELIAGMKTPTVSLVLGGGHSIGVPLAVSARRSFIVPSATMTIHPVRTNGLVLGIPQSFSYFEKMQDRIVNFVTSNSSISPERFQELMMKTGEMATDVGTVLDGESAVKEGLIGRLGGLADAIACLHDMIDEEAAEHLQTGASNVQSGVQVPDLPSEGDASDDSGEDTGGAVAQAPGATPPAAVNQEAPACAPSTHRSPFAPTPYTNPPDRKNPQWDGSPADSVAPGQEG